MSHNACSAVIVQLSESDLCNQHLEPMDMAKHQNPKTFCSTSSCGTFFTKWCGIRPTSRLKQADKIPHRSWQGRPTVLWSLAAGGSRSGLHQPTGSVTPFGRGRRLQGSVARAPDGLSPRGPPTPLWTPRGAPRGWKRSPSGVSVNSPARLRRDWRPRRWICGLLQVVVGVEGQFTIERGVETSDNGYARGHLKRQCGRGPWWRTWRRGQWWSSGRVSEAACGITGVII